MAIPAIVALIASAAPDPAGREHPLSDGAGRPSAFAVTHQSRMQPGDTGDEDESSPAGTPFDVYMTPAPEPLKTPEGWERAQPSALRAALGFSVANMDELFAASMRDPASAEAASRSSTGAPMTKSEFAEFERRMSMGDAQSRVVLKAQHIDGYAGNYIDQTASGTQVLLFTARADRRAVSELEAGYEYPTYLRIDSAKRSASELAWARDRAYEAMERAGLVEGREWAVYTDYRRNTVVLEYVPDAEGAAKEIAERAEIAVAPFSGYLDEVDCTDSACLPLSGGTNTGGGTDNCTWGYVLVLGGDLRVSTAGHCADDPRDAVRMWNGMALSRVSWIDGGAVDFAVYDIPADVWATNDLYRSNVGGNRFGLQVAGHRNPQQNDVVCKRGRVTDFTCGVVLTAAVGEQARADYLSCPGDSGAPVSVWSSTYSRVAVGSHTAGLPNGPGCPGGPVAGTRRFMIDQYISASFGHSVYAATMPRRDFVISLYARTLDRAPDQGGLTYWQAGVCDAAGLASPANYFFTGTEFRSLPATNEVSSSPELQERFYRLYRSVLRRAGSDSETQGWVNWVYGNAPAYPGSTLSEKRENAYSAAVSYFTTSSEFLSRFSSGGDGEIPLCAN